MEIVLIMMIYWLMTTTGLTLVRIYGFEELEFILIWHLLMDIHVDWFEDFCLIGEWLSDCHVWSWLSCIEIDILEFLVNY